MRLRPADHAVVSTAASFAISRLKVNGGADHDLAVHLFIPARLPCRCTAHGLIGLLKPVALILAM